MKKIPLMIALGCLGNLTRAQVQVYVSDGYNAGSTVYDFSNAETVLTAPSGIGYVSNNNGTYYHHGPASATITVNGMFNAYDYPGFGTPATPGIDWFQGLNGAQGSDQEIAGTIAPRFGILKLDNGPFSNFSITNTAGAEIGLRADFANAITTTVRSNSSTGALRFLDNATYANNNLGDLQYVNGYVGKTGNDAFTFPVGDQSGSDIRPLSISAPAATTDQLSVAYWKGDAATALDPTGGAHPRTSLNPTPLNGELLQSVSPIGFWDWIPVSGTSNVGITVSLPLQSGPGSYTVAGNIRLVGWNTANGQWELLGNGGASSLGEDASLSGSTGAYPGRTMASYSAIGWGSISQVPLPVKLVSFGVMASRCSAQLSWSTANEQGVSRFEIEHSTDGKRFTAVGSVAGAQRPAGAQYSYAYDRLAEGINYFRLKILDVGGSFAYSNTVSLRSDCSDAAPLLVRPNPTKGMVAISGLTSAKQTITLTDAVGHTVHSMAVAGQPSVILDLAPLPVGVYTLRVSDEAGHSTVTKLAKE